MGKVESNIKQEKKLTAFDKRIHEIDFVRGLLIILVVMDHIFWNFKSHGANWPGFNNDFFVWYWTGRCGDFYLPLRLFIQPMALMAFCFLSGISCAFSKNNWKRAIETLIVWAVITIGSNILQAISNANSWGLEVRIDFNIIGVLGFSMLFYCFVQKRSWKALLAAILISLLIYFYVMPNLKENLIRIFGSMTIEKAGHEMEIPKFYLPMFFFPPNGGFFGSPQADYVALFPYVSFFFGGALFAYKFYKKDRKSLVKKFEFERPVCFIGRHTLLIYLCHMPIVMGIFALIDVIVKNC